MNNLVLSLAPKFTRLQTLILRQDKPQLEDNAVESIANFCHDLQVLDLSKSFKLTDRSLYALAHGCPNLMRLNISGCSAFSDIALEYLAGFCPKMKVLNLCGCSRAASDRALQVYTNVLLYYLYLRKTVLSKFINLFAGYWALLQWVAVSESWLVWGSRWCRSYEFGIWMPWPKNCRLVRLCPNNRYFADSIDKNSCSSFSWLLYSYFANFKSHTYTSIYHLQKNRCWCRDK